MELSSEWKSLFPISFVFTPPLLLSGPSSKTILGPLIFNPKPQTLIHLFSSSSLLPFQSHHPNPNPHLSLPRFLLTSSSSSIPPSTSSAVANSLLAQNDAASTHHHNYNYNYNRLAFLKCPNSNTILVFFPTGVNSEQVGFLLLSVLPNSTTLDVQVNQNSDIFKQKTGFDYQIFRISANPVVADSTGNSSISIGYLLATTLYSVHWFVVKVNNNYNKEHGLNSNSETERPSLVCLGSKVFKSCSVVHCCWSPHIPEESVVLLENGGLFLFDLESCLENGNSWNVHLHLRGTKLRVSWDNSELASSGNFKWLSCEFSWHPRILIVVRSDAVFLVDLRFDECNVRCLVKVEMLSLYASVEKERFLLFAMAGSDGFCFAVASDSLLLLCDVRKPMMPVLQWAHGLNEPCYIDTFRLSELRSHSRDDTYKWASESGCCIILGSFWNCEFSLFCYGPSLPVQRASVASEVSEFLKTIYAWELPSDLLLSGRECRCGSCLVREEILKDDLPEWIDWQQKKEIVLGFGILNKDLSTLLSESEEFGGFTLIRLMSSGKLESQRYCASWDSVKKLKEFHRELSHFEDNFLYSLDDDEGYKFPRRFKYLKLDNLSAYLYGNLSKVLVSKMKKPCKVPLEKELFSTESHEILCEKLKACGFNRLRSSPAITVVFNDISLPESIHEVAMRRLWSSLPIELLQLAFSNYSEFLEVLVDQKKVALEFLVVPNLTQLPPFFLRKPSCRSNKWSQKVQPGDALVGPVLPLPVLHTIHEYHNGYSNMEEEASGFSLEAELSLRCEEVKQVASEMAVSDSGCELHRNHAVSLADDREEIWGNPQKQKSFFLYHPVAFKCSAMDHAHGNVFKDEKFDALIFKVSEKKRVPNSKTENVGQELFDDLCPTKLRFDANVKNFGPKELKAYNVLKRQWSKWQDGFNLYQEFCTKSKF